ncbi:hypothetical protein MP11Mi_10560 [Gordonia sp. MP11Mi]|uniref:Uncharacterized protein n=1 Tax=Gordonia sp. MP11Mi TaxID=3022769 RepID=A0AA97CVI4_9ACTN
MKSADPRPSGKTIQNKHAFLSGALKAAAVAGKIGRNPCDGQRISRTEKREMVFLSRPATDLVRGPVPTAASQEEGYSTETLVEGVSPLHIGDLICLSFQDSKPGDVILLFVFVASTA